jgi:predicted nucleic acid-binding protein
MPAAKMFMDTNILLYVHDRDGGEKSTRVLRWLHALALRQIACINMQVLNELTFVMLRKKWFSSVDETFKAVDVFAEFGTTPLTAETAASARDIHIRYRYAWWDCLLLASAINLGCSHFLSEDLKDGQTIQGLTIVSPFAHTPEQILGSP